MDINTTKHNFSQLVVIMMRTKWHISRDLVRSWSNTPYTIIILLYVLKLVYVVSKERLVFYGSGKTNIDIMNFILEKIWPLW